jgi:hypothetical protein
LKTSDWQLKNFQSCSISLFLLYFFSGVAASAGAAGAVASAGLVASSAGAAGAAEVAGAAGAVAGAGASAFFSHAATAVMARRAASRIEYFFMLIRFLDFRDLGVARVRDGRHGSQDVILQPGAILIKSIKISIVVIARQD